MSAPTHKPRRSRSGDVSERAPTLAALVCLAVLLCAGCSSPPGVRFEPATSELTWPAPPDAARIRFAGQLVSAADPKTGRASGGGMLDTLFGKKETAGMVSPMAVCSEGSRVFVVDSALACVHEFDLDRGTYGLWRPPEDEARFIMPVSAALTGGGRLLVADSADGAVFVFDAATGAFIGTIGDEVLRRPVGVAVDPADGRIVVADAESHTVHVLAPGGEEIARIGGRGTRDGQFNYPTYLAIDGEGRLYVSDSLNFRVQVFDRGLEHVLSIGSKGDLPGYFAQPKGVAVDRAGRVFVTDAHFEAVQLFDRRGRLLMSFGSEGREPGQFWLPAGVHIDAKGRVWIADSYNRRVQVFEPLGTEDGTEGGTLDSPGEEIDAGIGEDNTTVMGAGA